MEESIVIQQLQAQEICTLEKKEGIFHLNGYNIDLQIQELLKILAQSNKKMQSQITRDELSFGDTLYKMGYRGEIHKLKILESDSEEDEEEEDDDELSEENSNTQLQTKYSQDIIGSLDEIYQSNLTKKEKYFEKIQDTYQQLQLDLLQDQFHLEFISPFFLKNPFEQIHLPGNITIDLSCYNSVCDKCSSQGNLKYFSQQLLPFGEVIIEQLKVLQKVRTRCEHMDIGNWEGSVRTKIIQSLNEGGILSRTLGKCLGVFDQIIPVTYSYPNQESQITTPPSLKGEKYLKFKELFISNDNFSYYQDPMGEITITQDDSLKSVVISYHVLTKTNFIQDNSRYLSSLFIRNNKDNLNTQNLKKELEKLRFSELQLSPGIMGDHITPSFLNQLDYLIYIKLSGSYDFYDSMKWEYLDILNDKYSKTLRIFAFQKLFGDQFSLFRMMYDLYEFDYETPTYENFQ